MEDRLRKHGSLTSEVDQLKAQNNLLQDKVRNLTNQVKDLEQERDDMTQKQAEMVPHRKHLDELEKQN